MPGRKSRDKGNRLERLVVNTLRAAGQQASRVPLSGAAGGDYQDDIVWKLPTQSLNIECKARAHGFKFIYDNLKPGRPLILKADNQEPVFVCTLSQAIDLIGKTNISTQSKTLESLLKLEHVPTWRDTYSMNIACSLEHGCLERLSSLSAELSRGGE